MMDPVDRLEIEIVSDLGDIGLAAEIGKFIRDAISEGFVSAAQISELVIVKRSMVSE